MMETKSLLELIPSDYLKKGSSVKELGKVQEIFYLKDFKAKVIPDKYQVCHDGGTGGFFCGVYSLRMPRGKNFFLNTTG